jgi:uncharacterized membrane protein
MPPIPTWDGLHPLIVHFPIALLLVAPLLVLIGSALKGKSRPFLITAFILMLIGSVATWFAISTGNSAGELAERFAGVEGVLENHEELAETTAMVFSALTAIFGVIVFAPMVFHKDLARKVLLPLNLAFLLFYSAGAVLLINTAHEGGRLVHQFGVRAVMAAPDGASADGQRQRREGHHDDDDD